MSAKPTTTRGYGKFGQWCWLIVGGWTGLWAYELIRAAYVPLNKFDADFLLLPAIVVSPLFLAPATLAFPLGHWFRTQELSRAPQGAWWAPLLSGMPIGPMLAICFEFDPILTLLLANLMSMPAAEVCVRLARRRDEPPA